MSNVIHDISLCRGLDCPLRKECRRYTLKSDSEYQSYIIELFKIKDGIFTCEMFWGETQEQIYDKLKSITGTNE